MNNLINKKVGVFLVGSRKSGTTSLANFLDSHIDISLGSIKEPNYFNDRDRKPLDSYHSLFDWSSKIQLDASTSYTANFDNSKNISEEIHGYNPSAKIIYIIRDPLDRIVSHYRMSYERGDINLTLNEAINSHKLLLSCSQYYSQINKYIISFGRKNVLILNNTDLNNTETKKKLIEFLQLNRSFNKEMSKDNAADNDFRMPKYMDGIFSNKIYFTIKKTVPKSIITYIKSKCYYRINRKMSLALNSKSKTLLQYELLTDMEKLQGIIDFDISSWIEKLKAL